MLDIPKVSGVEKPLIEDRSDSAPHERGDDLPSIWEQQKEIERFVHGKFGEAVRVQKRQFGNVEQVFFQLKEAVVKKNSFSTVRGHDPVKYMIRGFIDEVGADSRITDLETDVFQTHAKRLYHSLREFHNLDNEQITKVPTPPDDWVQKLKELIQVGRVSNDYARLNKFLVEHVVETNNQEMRKEFKIHLNPDRAHSREIVQRFLSRLSRNTDLKQAITAVKIATRDRGSDTTTLADVADIILYIEPKEDVEGTLSRCMNVLDILSREFEDDQEKGKPEGEPPRNNFAINRLLYIAQSGGDMKSWLKKMKDPDGADSDTMLDRFFDGTMNHAFFKEDAERAVQIFSSLRNVEIKKTA